MKTTWISMAILVGILGLIGCSNFAKTQLIEDVYKDMAQSEFYKVYPKQKARSYRQNNHEQWITYNHRRGIVSFHVVDGKVRDWEINDRQEAINEYVPEFVSGQFAQDDAKIGRAIEDVLKRMPFEDFLKVTDRRRPVIFTETWDSGTARFANSTEFVVGEDDIACCQEGFTLLKLSLSLNQAKTPDAIKGIVAHELAHRVLDHIKNGHVSCNAEREANALIQKWGFKKELKEAGQLFGHKEGDPAPCQEK
jgi:hypothetical protein